MKSDEPGLAPHRLVAVIGAGAMGRGIAQLLAQSGIPVRLFDSQPAAVDAAIAQVRETFERLVEKNRMSAQDATAAGSRLHAAASLDSIAGCDLVVEAIVERLEAKRALFQALEPIVGDDATLATNTSSLSVTAIAAGCARPQRVVGWHFFNPVPLMKIVEVIEGVRTDPDRVRRLVDLSRLTGHLPVIARDTPGFIVNHAGRGYGTEALRALSEGVADIPTIDRILREQVDFDGNGFRLGPFELMDLTGLDVSHPVMESIYRQFYDEPRFRPSVVTAQRYQAGLFGRKTGEGFYTYAGGKAVTMDEPAVPAGAPSLPVWIAPGSRRDSIAQAVSALGAQVENATSPSRDALVLLAPIGLDASAAAKGLPAERAVAIDTLFPIATGHCRRRVLMTTPATLPAFRDAAHALFAADGCRVSMLRDSPGFVSQRVLAMIVAIATEIAQQRIASPQDIDTAVRLGLGYPLGPLTMGDRMGASTVLEILSNIHDLTGDPRYRPGAWLRRRAQLGLSLLHED